MRLFVLFSILTVLLLSAEARIDNKFSTEYHHQKQHDKQALEHHVPVVNLDTGESDEVNVVEPGIDKVKGHMRREGHQGVNIYGNHDKKPYKDHGNSGRDHHNPNHRGYDKDPGALDHQVKGHHNKDGEKNHHDKDNSDHGFNHQGMRSTKINRRGKKPEHWKRWKVQKHSGSAHMKKEKQNQGRKMQMKELLCKCTYCGEDNQTCATNGACFVTVEKSEELLIYKYGCLAKKVLQPPGDPLMCHQSKQLAHKSAITCCYDNMCNKNVENEPQLSKEPQGEVTDLCSNLKCKRKQLCVIKPDTGEAECVKLPKKMMKKIRKKDKKSAWKTKDVPKKHDNKKKSITQNKKAHKMAKKMKHKAEKFQHKYEEKKRHRLHHMKDLANHKRAPNHMDMEIDTHQVPDVNNLPQKTAPIAPNTYCSARELSDMGKRLLDLFKVLQDEDPSDQPHVIQKRNSKKKELHELDECICQSPVRSEFLRLDKNQDDFLSLFELDGLESNGYEHCIKPFIESCDHNKDGSLSDREWCCCFADVLPPCLAEMTKVPAALAMGAPSIMPGAFVPQCDSDGFFRPVQCHGSIGYCWCVSRAGIKIEGTHTRGTPNCVVQEDVDRSSNLIGLE